MTELNRERELLLACPVFRSRVNLSRIVRLAGCCGVRRIVTEGNPKVDSKIARDAVDYVRLEQRRSLAPYLKKLRKQNLHIVGLEQTSHSRNLYEYSFHRRTVLVIGHERMGITNEVLSVCDECLEIPVYGMPHSYNVVTATTMALYEYCKQYPDG